MMPILIATGNVLMEGRRAAETPLLAVRAEVIVNPDSGAAAQIQPVRERELVLSLFCSWHVSGH